MPSHDSSVYRGPLYEMYTSKYMAYQAKFGVVDCYFRERQSIFIFFLNECLKKCKIFFDDLRKLINTILDYPVLYIICFIMVWIHIYICWIIEVTLTLKHVV